MKFTQKTKYFGYGIVAAAMLAPLVIKAASAVPFLFREGDVISATVINTLFSRVNDVVTGFVDVTELDGDWDCTTYSTRQDAGDSCVAAGELLRKKTGILHFDASKKTFNYSGSGDPRGCFVGAYMTSGKFDVQGGFLVSDYGVYEARKRGPNEFLWTLNSALPPNGYVVCSKHNAPPPPADQLAALVTGNSVALSWVDQSSGAAGFKVQRKTSAAGEWTEVTQTGQNVTKFVHDKLPAGTYWYRILATTSNGDSISSSEVQVTVR